MQSSKGLVSVLTPCYNTEKYIGRLLDSILSQTYPFIEMIVVDDGSTDKSQEIIKNYIPLFEAKGYRLSYVYQPNQGQSFAIKNGLKKIHGEFLVWPDSDDFYASKDAISKMVSEFRNSSSSVGIVRCKAYLIDDTENVNIIGEVGQNASYNIERLKIFEDCLFSNSSFYFPPGEYMLRVELLNNSIKGEIYTEKDAGQNWQLMLPMLYNYDCLTIQEKLYYVTVRKNSHSRGSYKGFEENSRKFKAYEQTILATLENIKNLDEAHRKDYAKKIKNKYLIQKLHEACIYGKRKEAYRAFKSMFSAKIVTIKDFVYLLVCVLGLQSPINRLRRILS